MSHVRPILRQLACVLTLAVVAAVPGLAMPAVASADTVPPDATTPATVSADALPTVQIDGVAWSQAVVGTTVYAGGSFTTARPAGAAAGTQTTSRNNLLAYDITTGALNTSFAPSLNGQVKAVAASPDGSRLYVGGQFTTADGVARYRVAAYNITTGALVSSFAPQVDATVSAIAATNTTVYVGGALTSANGVPRGHVAAFNAADGALLTWAPSADDNVSALVITPDGSRVIAGGNFQNVSGTPAYGLTAIDATTGAVLPWAANQKVRNAGPNAGITSLRTDGSKIYGTGYVFGAGGNLEGAFAAVPNTGDVLWIEDCHGDTYSSFPVGSVVYTVSHAHYCQNIGGYPETKPRSFHRALAFTTDASGQKITKDTQGYANWEGNDRPSLLNWWPDLEAGTYTGQTQAAWNVTGNADYVVMGGEFPKVNSTGQQGLVRFAVRAKAPNAQGPVIRGAPFNPTLTAGAGNAIRITWPANWDRDNQLLTYKLVRDSDTAAPIFTTSQRSTFWQRPPMGYVDGSVTPGQTYRYRLFATDPTGAVSASETVTAVANATAALGSYAQKVLSDGAKSYWRLGEPTGPRAVDAAGFDDLTNGVGVLGGAVGVADDGDTASSFDGSTSGRSGTTNALDAPAAGSVEAWFKTTSTAGGKIVGFGSAATGTSSKYDRHLYLTNNGRLAFGVYTTATKTITTTGTLNDGAWHHAVGTFGPAGLSLIVDGRLIGTDLATTTASSFTGYWRVGGDNLGGWPNVPTSASLTGSIDEVAVYPTQLTPSQVAAHYVATGRVPKGSRPADRYGAAVWDSAPESYWRLGETAGSVAADASTHQVEASYTGGYTLGRPGAVTGTSDTAVAFDGTSGRVVSTQPASNPQTFSTELWFNTTTTRGGRLIGFGNSQAGTSTQTDRQVVMLDTGRLRFSAKIGAVVSVDSPNGYNDGRWHHVVTTDSSTTGLRLYVDGAQVAANATGGAQSMTGWWRVGGDATGLTGSTSTYFNGDIDEVAIYSSVLSAAAVTNHYGQGGGAVPNVAPTASFTSSTTKLTSSFDASASSDQDGRVVSYGWDFGDGSTGTGTTVSHTYASAGTFAVTLTVTDDAGATGTAARSVVIVANTAPTASFTSTTTKLTTSFDASASSDQDGRVVSYGWDFGDGSTGTGATVSHTYALAGTFTVRLTVVDDDGASGVTARTVTSVANVAPTALFTDNAANLAVTFDASGSTDTDGRVVAYSWAFGDGATGSGSTVTHSYAAAGSYQVTASVTDDDGATASATRTVTATAPVVNQAPVAAFASTTSGLTASLNGSASTDPDGTVAGYVWAFGDGSSGTGVMTDHAYVAAGTYTVTLTVTDDAGKTSSVTHDVTVTAPTPVPYAKDEFARSLAGAWGSAETGGAWTLTGGASNFAVGNGVGTTKMATAGAQTSAVLGSVSSADVEAQVDVSFDKVQTGGGTYVSVLARRVSATSDYRARLRFTSDGKVTVGVNRNVAGAETVMQSVVPANVTYVPGTAMHVRVQVSGASPTTVRAKAWSADAPEPPAWTVSTTDSTPELQVAGAVGLLSYESASATNAPITAAFDHLWVGPRQAG